jgi:hypothetical protein
MVHVGKCEADAWNTTDRIARCQQIDRQVVHLHRTGNRLRDHRRITAEYAVRVDGDFEPPVGFLLDPVSGDLVVRHRRMFHRRRRTQLVGEFRRVGRPAQDGRGAKPCRSCHDAPARQPVA